MKTRPLMPILLAAACAVTIGGYGTAGGSGAKPALIPVKGKGTYKDHPVTHGVVAFEPDGYGRAAKGDLQSDGTFILGTYEERDGVAPGKHGCTSASDFFR
jgi:hypothetical protein